jgi:hypothetical protein
MEGHLRDGAIQVSAAVASRREELFLLVMKLELEKWDIYLGFLVEL